MEEMGALKPQPDNQTLGLHHSLLLTMKDIHTGRESYFRLAHSQAAGGVKYRSRS